jgi:ribose transport system permease protein
MSAAAPTVDVSPRRLTVPLPTGPLLGLIGVFALFVILIGLKGDLRHFLSAGNLRILLHEITIPGIVALGMLLVIVSGGIDLSVGSVIALVTVVTMQVYRALFTGPESVATASAAAVAAGIAVGGLCGLTNGLVIVGLKLPPFVATLGMLGIARGLAIALAERRLVAFPEGAAPEWVQALNRVQPQPEWLLMNPGFWSLVVLAALTALLLRATVLGRYVYAIGSSEATARLCGVAVGRTKVIIYTLAGLLTGWAGILLFAHGTAGDPSGGEGMELQVIAAVVIGGAALTGGVGSVGGTLLGVLILGLLGNGVSVFDVPVEIQYILIGVIIIGNAALGRWQRARAAVT